ncbi:MAG: prepilin-type N-terminal cleavage/methylation domain-containing protein [Burkholderiales bacterium]|nr:prepilin-type N-terminal cleavage/methylation domain-containing protein [Burkholderiales bacterium]
MSRRTAFASCTTAVHEGRVSPPHGRPKGARAPSGLRAAAPGLPAQAWTARRGAGSVGSAACKASGPRAAGERGGFTLVEVLVALAILAVMAALTWRGIDGMARAQQATGRHTDEVLTLQAGLAQWRADLDAMMIWPTATPAPTVTPGATPAPAAAPQRSLAWDGRVLRITRTGADAAAGLRVVAWARRADDGQWLRWQSAPVQSLRAWQAAWDAAARWAEAGAAADPGNPNASVAAVASTLNWQLHYFRGNAWTNPLSSPDPGAAQALPDAVRLLLVLAPGQAVTGPVTLDWVRLDFGGGS